MSFTQEFSIRADHPSLAGHFPDQPVVPGVVILQQVENALKSWQDGSVILAWPQVKFVRPLLPNSSCKVELTPSGKQQVKFKCSNATAVIASGIFDYDLGVRE